MMYEILNDIMTIDNHDNPDRFLRYSYDIPLTFLDIPTENPYSMSEKRRKNVGGMSEDEAW